MDMVEFHYTPTCSAPNCRNEALYKVAATWSSGPSWELKNYGLACDEHRHSQLMRGRLHRQDLAPADDEVVGEVGLYRLDPGKHDPALNRMPEYDGG